MFAYKSENHSLKIAVDALHPNNNSESVNIGGEYSLKLISAGVINLRAGYNGLFMVNSQYGLTFGVGVGVYTFGNQKVDFEYAYRDHETLGTLQTYSLKYAF